MNTQLDFKFYVGVGVEVMVYSCFLRNKCSIIIFKIVEFRYCPIDDLHISKLRNFKILHIFSWGGNKIDVFIMLKLMKDLCLFDDNGEQICFDY